MKIEATYCGEWRDSRGRRHTEWHAIDESTYDGVDDAGSMRTMGVGRTREEAIEDLLFQFEHGVEWQRRYYQEWRNGNGS